MLVVGGLIASVVLPQHAAAITAGTCLVSAIRRKSASGESSSEPRQACSNGESVGGGGEQAEVTLQWSGLSLSIQTAPSKRGGTTSNQNGNPNGDHPHAVPVATSAPTLANEKRILDDVYGRALPGRVTAIAGPSGSGKTSLLTALAGRIPQSSKLFLNGTVTANGVSMASAGALAQNAFVPQDDLFFSELTVRETLELAAKMHLPNDMSEDEKKAFVNGLIAKLSLGPCENTRVGNAKVRGISGGEKKRLSLGCELISSPRLIFADEPTSGLDSYQAAKVMSTLRTLAQAGHTVVISIHQPSGAVYSMCDDLVLLAGGSVVYVGPTANAPEYFKEKSLPVPPNVNPSEHFLQMISVDSESAQSKEESENRIRSLVLAFKQHKASLVPPKVSSEAVHIARDSTRRSPLGPLRQVKLLIQRAFRQVTRDKKTNIARFMSSLWSGLVFASIYWRMGYAQSTIQDRLGLLQVCCINASMSALVKTLQTFGVEREVVARERGRGAYGVLAYFSSKLVAELPISAFFPLLFSAIVYPTTGLSGGAGRVGKFMGIITLEAFSAASYGLLVGAVAPSPEAAVAIGPSSFVLFIVFGGLYVSDENVPSWLRWLPRISIIKHAFEALCVNELRGIEFVADRPWDVRTGEQQLQRMSWGNSTVLKACISQSRVIAVNYLLTYAALKMRSPRYQVLEPAVEFEELDTAEPEVAKPGSGTPDVTVVDSSKPAGVETAASNPSAVALSTVNHSTSESVAAAPVDEASAPAEPMPPPPVVDDPIVEEPAIEEPTIEEPVASEPVASEPTVAGSMPEEPAAEEATAEEPAAEETAAEEPAAEEATAEEPAAEETAVEEPATEIPATGEPAPDEPSAKGGSDATPPDAQPAHAHAVSAEPTAPEPVVAQQNDAELAAEEIPSTKPETLEPATAQVTGTKIADVDQLTAEKAHSRSTTQAFESLGGL